MERRELARDATELRADRRVRDLKADKVARREEPAHFFTCQLARMDLVSYQLAAAQS